MWCSTAGFIVTLTLSMLAVPLVAGAQPVGKVPTIGFLTHNAATQTTQAFEAFAQGLRELGYIEGQTMTIERRYAEGRFERVPALVADLAARHIDVFVVTTNLIAKAVTSLKQTVGATVVSAANGRILRSQQPPAA